MIRNQDGNTVYHVIELTKSEFIQSDFYFLQQNDILYVRPNSAKVKSSGVVGNVATASSVLSLILSIIIIIVR